MAVVQSISRVVVWSVSRVVVKSNVTFMSPHSYDMNVALRLPQSKSPRRMNLRLSVVPPTGFEPVSSA